MDDIVAAILVETAEAVPVGKAFSAEGAAGRSARPRLLNGVLRFFRLRNDDPDLLRLYRGRLGPLDLIEDRAVSRVHADARDADQSAIRLFIHQIAANGKDVLARAEFAAAQAAVLAQCFDRVLEVLDVGGSLLVDHNEIGQ